MKQKLQIAALHKHGAQYLSKSSANAKFEGISTSILPNKQKTRTSKIAKSLITKIHT